MLLRTLGLLAAALLCSAAMCDKEEDACGLKTALPDVAAGSLTATKDGASYTAPCGGSARCGWKASDLSDIVAGGVQLSIGRDKDGNRVDEAINAGSFPICILLNDSSDGTSYAYVNDATGSYTTDGTHTGAVVLLGKEGDQLVGRFEFEAVQNSGSRTTRYEDGAFRLGPR